MKTLDEHLKHLFEEYFRDIAKTHQTTVATLVLFREKDSPIKVEIENFHDTVALKVNEKEKVVVGLAQESPIDNLKGQTELKQSIQYVLSEQDSQSLISTNEYEFGAAIKSTVGAKAFGLEAAIEANASVSTTNTHQKETAHQNQRTQGVTAEVVVPAKCSTVYKIQAYRLTETHTFIANFKLTGHIELQFADNTLKFDTKTGQCTAHHKSTQVQTIPLSYVFSILHTQNKLNDIKATIDIQGDVVWLKGVKGKHHTPLLRLETTVVKSEMAADASPAQVPPAPAVVQTKTIDLFGKVGNFTVGTVIGSAGTQVNTVPKTTEEANAGLIFAKGLAEIRATLTPSTPPVHTRLAETVGTAYIGEMVYGTQWGGSNNSKAAELAAAWKSSGSATSAPSSSAALLTSVAAQQASSPIIAKKRPELTNSDGHELIALSEIHLDSVPIFCVKTDINGLKNRFTEDVILQLQKILQGNRGLQAEGVMKNQKNTMYKINFDNKEEAETLKSKLENILIASPAPENAGPAPGK